MGEQVKGHTLFLLILLCSPLVLAAKVPQTEVSMITVPDDGTHSSTSDQNPDWWRTYGGPNREDAYDLIQTTDGGFALGGYTESYGAGDRDFWLVRTDGAGVEMWNRTYGGADSEIINSLIQSSGSGFVLAGKTDSFGAGGEDFWLVKTDQDGYHQWNRTFGGLNDDYAYSVVETSDGGYAVAGYTESYGAGDKDFWLIKTNSTGHAEWNRTYGGSSQDFPQSLIQTVDGGYAIAGDTHSYGSGLDDFWLVKTDSDGNHLWNRTYGGVNYDGAWEVVQTHEGGYALAGRTWSYGSGASDMWLVKTDSTGHMEWNETYGGTIEDRTNSLVQTDDGGYVMGGWTRSFGAGADDFWLVKTDATGTMQWHRAYGGAGVETATQVIVTADGGYAMAGWTESFGAGDFDFWLVKTEVEFIVPDDFSTIQAAINAADEGDIIFVKNGTYFEHLIVNKSLTLQGECRNTTIIDCAYGSDTIINVTANSVKLSGFTIQHTGGRALWIDIYGNLTFSDNIIVGCSEGVRLHRSSNNVVSDNIVQDCFHNTGIGIDWGVNNTIHRNIIIHNNIGMSGGVDCHGNLFSENTIINNTVGFGSTSYDNIFIHNNFINNGVGLSGVNQLDNGCEGNYWSDYDGNDSDADGIGDTPCVINGDNIDNYPLMNPYWNPADINKDLSVDIFDVVIICDAYGSTPSDLNWNCHCDIVEPFGIIDMLDVVLMAVSYGEEYHGP